MKEIKLLNHGYARLVSYMQPAEPSEGWTGDLEIVRNARNSFDAAWRAGEDAGKDAKLINYLIEHLHTTPLESMTFTFDVKLPLFVARQWMRHRTWAYSEISARYTEVSECYYIPEVSAITTQSKDNKQARTDEMHKESELIQRMITAQCESAFATYQQLLKIGTPRELARGVLPVNTYTSFFGTVNLHNLLHFIKLRIHPHAQYEVRVYAQALLDLIRPIVAISVAAWEKHSL